MTLTIDTHKMHYRDLNIEVKKAMERKVKKIILENVNGQRYIGDAIQGKYELIINGLPGNNLAVFMDGSKIIVNGNVQEGTANTMNSGQIIIHGSAGDTLAYGMRGGEIYIRDNVGYRAGIHMKEYQKQKPLLVIGGIAGDFLGEYMAGGTIIVLNREELDQSVGAYCASGIHGGNVYIRGTKNLRLNPGLKILSPNCEDFNFIYRYVEKYQEYFEITIPEMQKDDFIKIGADDARPYKKLYIGL